MLIIVNYWWVITTDSFTTSINQSTSPLQFVMALFGAFSDRKPGVPLHTVVQVLDRPALVVGTDDLIIAVNNSFVSNYEFDPTDEHRSTLPDSYSFPSQSDLQGEGHMTIGTYTGVVTYDRTELSTTADDPAGVLESFEPVSDDTVDQELDALLAYQTQAIGELRETLSKLATGDLTATADITTPETENEAVLAAHDSCTKIGAELELVIERFRRALDSMDEQAEDLSAMSADLGSTTEETTTAVNELGHSADEIATMSDTVAQQAETASNTVTDISTSIEEITATSEQIATVSEDTAQKSDVVAATVDEAVSEIEEATSTTREVTNEIEALARRMDEVSDIVSVITDIADQTNILALNASIEAARADTDGAGFAVVADEVKSLATETKSSAEEIEALVEDVTHQTDNVVSTARLATDRIDDGAALVREVDTDLETIECRSDEAHDGVEEIAAALDQQASGIHDLEAIVDEFSSMSEELASSASQIAASTDEQTEATANVTRQAEHLSTLSDSLYELLDSFKLDSDDSAALDQVDTVVAESGANVKQAETVPKKAD